MRGRWATFRRLVVAAFVLASGTARAQQTVCPPVAPGERVQVSCRPFSLFPATRFLSDFTVDHLFKPSPPTFQRSLVDAAQVLAARELSDNPGLKGFLESLAPLRFTQLDRTTGTVLADFDEQHRAYQSRLQGSIAGETSLVVSMPAHLRGGYWRGPDALQVAFWENGRPSVSIAAGDDTFEGDIACIALSPDSMLVRFAPETTHPVLILFRECPQ